MPGKEIPDYDDYEYDDDEEYVDDDSDDSSQFTGPSQFGESTKRSSRFGKPESSSTSRFANTRETSLSSSTPAEINQWFDSNESFFEQSDDLINSITLLPFSQLESLEDSTTPINLVFSYFTLTQKLFKSGFGIEHLINVPEKRNTSRFSGEVIKKEANDIPEKLGQIEKWLGKNEADAKYGEIKIKYDTVVQQLELLKESIKSKNLEIKDSWAYMLFLQVHEKNEDEEPRSRFGRGMSAEDRRKKEIEVKQAPLDKIKLSIGEIPPLSLPVFLVDGLGKENPQVEFQKRIIEYHQLVALKERIEKSQYGNKITEVIKDSLLGSSGSRFGSEAIASLDHDKFVELASQAHKLNKELIELEEKVDVILGLFNNSWYEKVYKSLFEGKKEKVKKSRFSGGSRFTERASHLGNEAKSKLNRMISMFKGESEADGNDEKKTDPDIVADIVDYMIASRKFRHNNPPEFNPQELQITSDLNKGDYGELIKTMDWIDGYIEGQRLTHWLEIGHDQHIGKIEEEINKYRVYISSGLLKSEYIDLVTKAIEELSEMINELNSERDLIKAAIDGYQKIMENDVAFRTAIIVRDDDPDVSRFQFLMSQANKNN